LVDLGVIRGFETGIAIEEESFNTGFKTLSSSIGTEEAVVSSVDVITEGVSSSSIEEFKYKLLLDEKRDTGESEIFSVGFMVVNAGVVVVEEAIGINVEAEEMVFDKDVEGSDAFKDDDNNGSKLAIEVIADKVDASELVDREDGVAKGFKVEEEEDKSVDNNEDSFGNNDDVVV